MKTKLLNLSPLFILFCLNFTFSNPLFAQQNTLQADSLDNYAQTIGLILLIGVLVMFIILMIYGSEKYKYSGKGILKPKTVSKFASAISQAVPLEKESEIIMAHDYDGIKELDNKVPPWFNVLFYGTIVFAIVYLLVFHVFRLKPLMIEEYSEEVQSSQMRHQELLKSGALINENTVTLLKDPESLQNGKTIFQANCVPCHGQNGEGIVGPNLTDNYWIHGGGINNVFKTIKIGVPEKGMISWQNILNPKKIQEVASYVISLQGTNPPNGKPPEGQIWVDTTSTKTNKDSTVLKPQKIKSDSLKIKLIDTTKIDKSIKKK